MKKVISAIIATSMLLSLITSAMAFSDIDNSEYKNEITKLSELGIIDGFEDNTFRADDTVTRAQAVKMLAVIKGFDAIKSEDYHNITGRADFEDFTISHWAFKYAHYIMSDVMYIDENGSEIPEVQIIDGYEDGTFRPDNNVTVAELIKMAVCSMGEVYNEEAVNNGVYPDGYIQTAEQYGITEGIDMSNINANATRGQTAKIISNTINLPIKQKLVCNDISDNHEITEKRVIAVYDGTNPHFPLKTMKSMLETGDRSSDVTVNISPLDETEEFFAYAEIESVAENEAVIKSSLFINTDGSVYNKLSEFKADIGGFDLTEISDNFYYLKLKKQDNKWIVDNYAVQ